MRDQQHGDESSLECPICHHSSRPLYRSNFPNRPWMRRCEGCGLCFLESSVTYAAASMYLDGYTASQKAALKNQRLSGDYFAKIRPVLPSEGRFLEVGGSHGALSKLVKEHTGLLVTMIEPGCSAAESARKQGIDTYCGFLHEFQTRERYHTLFAAHVIEHVDELKTFLLQCAELLTPEGQIILLTPNANAWKFRLCKERWPWSARGEHTFLLTSQSAKLLLEECGLAVSSIRPTHAAKAHYPCFLANFLSGIYRRHIAPSPSSPPSPPSSAPPASGKNEDRMASAIPEHQPQNFRSKLAKALRIAGLTVLSLEYYLLKIADRIAGPDSLDELMIIARKSTPSQREFGRRRL